MLTREDIERIRIVALRHLEKCSCVESRCYYCVTSEAKRDLCDTTLALLDERTKIAEALGDPEGKFGLADHASRIFREHQEQLTSLDALRQQANKPTELELRLARAIMLAWDGVATNGAPICRMCSRVGCSKDHSDIVHTANCPVPEAQALLEQASKKVRL